MKRFAILFLAILSVPVLVSAQVNESQATSSRTESKFAKQVFTVNNNPSTDQMDQFEITGIGGATFTAANITDGTTNSYLHTLKITLTLIQPPGKAGTFQLIFYPPSENIQQAASYVGGVLNIYYPISMYEGIKEKLDQSIAARKKIFVKVVQKNNGYREGSLLF